MNYKKILSTLTALTIAASSMVNVLALSDDVYSTDTTVLSDALSQMTESERTSFINEHLDIKLQHLSTLATLTSNQQLDQIADEVQAALKDGVSSIEIKEAIYHSGAYCGLTRAAKALDEADKALSALGENTAYQSRITWNENERYTKGLEVQRYLFGQQIGTITDEMEKSVKAQTVYLSGICFGDFYNRSGLSLYTREFLTLCTIAANGNCRSQLGGHVNGNLSIGHDKDMLRAAMLLNEQYNGAEKTALAMEAINSSQSELNENPPEEPQMPEASVETSYSSDSEEILAIFDHFKSDDTDGYINANLSSEVQSLLNQATEAVINGTEIPKSSDKATQLLIDIAVMAAQGGRESEIPAKVTESIAAGTTLDSLLCVPLLTAPYNGFPRTLNMRGAIAAAAAENQEEAVMNEATIITMQIDNPKFTINGTETNIDEDGTVPVIMNERTLMPIRAFVEGIGGTVEWDNDAREATLTYNNSEIRLIIDSSTAYLNGTEHTLDVAPVIINNRTMLPIRFIAESFGYTVNWDDGKQRVIIVNAEKIENIFEKGELNPAEPRFTGTSYLHWLTTYNDEMKIPAFGHVTFEPCTRTDWHYHDGGQILLVTEGTGVLGMEDEQARIMEQGDVILIPPGKKHFHSAIDNSQFAHIAIGVNPGVGTTHWFEEVSDEEYYKSVETARNNAVTAQRDTTMFSKGEAFASTGYTGSIYKNLLVENETTYNCPEVDYFTFEVGARTEWHSNENGKVILVTDGVGVYQEENSEVRTIKAGDVIEIKPGVKHWYGTSNELFAFIEVNSNAGNNTATWDISVPEQE